MADILTKAEARKAINLPNNDTTRDTELESLWIPAVTQIVEDLVGPVMTQTKSLTVDGGGRAVLLPHLNATITSVLEGDVELVADAGYSFNAAAGILVRGSATSPAYFAAGSNNVVITYTAGYATTAADVPAKIKLAARIILAHLWQSQTAYRPALGGTPDDSTSHVPAGYAVPRKALELLGTGVDQFLGFA